MLKIGFVYDQIDELPETVSSAPVTAEYEDAATLDWFRSTLGRWGDVIDLPFSREVVGKIDQLRPDVLFNITEAFGGRNRESLIPALAEIEGIPCTGSDAVSLGLSLDKRLTKIMAAQAGVPTPEFVLLRRTDPPGKYSDELNAIGFPLIVKPNCGGSSMGITRGSKVHSMPRLLEAVHRIRQKIDDDILIERFIPGREITAGLLEKETLTHLPLAETRFGDGGPGSFYSIEMKSIHEKQVICPAESIAGMEKKIRQYAEIVFRAIGCKDLARVDFRVDKTGVPYFIEINPLPGLSPHYSIYPMQARAAGISPAEILHQLLLNNVPKQTGEKDGRFSKLAVAGR